MGTKRSKKNVEYNITSDYINVKTSTTVLLNEEFVVFTQEGPLSLMVEIKGDLQNIPEKYHEVFLNVLTSKYCNKVSFGENPFSECKPLRKRKWWEFWKSNYITD